MRQFARLAILQALVLCSSFGFVRADEGPQGTAATRADEEIEKLKRQLLDTDAEARERAIVGLLGRTELEAHRVLQEALLRGADAAGVSDKILMHLAIALTNASHPVFADTKLRPVLVREYLLVLLRYFAGDSAPPGAATLEERALRCIRSLNYLERKEVLAEVVRGENRDLARAAVRAAGGARDVGTLAPWLFELSIDAELGTAARIALARLTFVDGGFADRAAFDAWMAENGQRQFVDLAEDAARRSTAAVTTARKQADAAFIAQTARLVAALARADSPDWAAIRAETLAPEPRGRTLACLQSLRDAMEPRAIGGARPGGVVQDRQTFVNDLLARIAAGPEGEEYAVLLETIAYLTVLDDTAQRAAAEAELLRALASQDRVIRLAALHGLRRFPSTAHRRAVVDLALQALAAHENDTLTAALQCLREGDWQTPVAGDADEESWFLLLQRVLTEPGLELRQRELALGIATLKEAQEPLLSRLFELLLGVAGSPDRELALRRQVLPRLWQFTRDERRSEQYVAKTVELLADPAPEMRALAASQLEILPESSQARIAEWNRTIVMRASDRLLIEPDRKVVSAIVDLLLHVTEDPSSADEVVGRLKNAAVAMAQNPKPEDADRRAILIEALRVIGVGRDRQLPIWVAAGQGLAVLHAREPLLQVLDRQQLENLTDVANNGVAAAFELVLDAARLAPDDPPWTARQDEARAVVHAFEQLEAGGKPQTTSADRVLRLRALLALGRNDEVVERGNAALAATVTPPVEDRDRAAILLAVAEAQIDLDDLDGAAARLNRLDEIENGHEQQTLSLWTSLASRRVAAGAAADAVAIAERVLQRTPVDAREWRERFLLGVEARLSADPEGSREAVLDDLRTHESRFSGTDVTPELQARYAELRRRAETGRTVAPGR